MLSLKLLYIFIYVIFFCKKLNPNQWYIQCSVLHASVTFHYHFPRSVMKYFSAWTTNRQTAKREGRRNNFERSKAEQTKNTDGRCFVRKFMVIMWCFKTQGLSYQIGITMILVHMEFESITLTMTTKNLKANFCFF